MKYKVVYGITDGYDYSNLGTEIVEAGGIVEAHKIAVERAKEMSSQRLEYIYVRGINEVKE